MGYNRLIEVMKARTANSGRGDVVDPDLIQLIWRPAEVVQYRRTASFRALQRLSDTIDCDVYALGIVFYEILTGQYPNDVDLDSFYSVIRKRKSFAILIPNNSNDSLGRHNL